MSELRFKTKLIAWNLIIVASMAGAGCKSDGGAGSDRDAVDDGASDGGDTTGVASWCGRGVVEPPGRDAPGCPAEAEIPASCDGDSRPVCGIGCVEPFDRVCMTDDHCRADEVCRLVGERDTTGTCILTGADDTCCPGGPGCSLTEADGISVGFAKVDMIPDAWEFPRPEFMEGHTFNGNYLDPTSFCDCGTDGICPATIEYEDCPDFGPYVGPDANGTEGDGEMQSLWLAGFSNNRPALLCNDEQIGDGCEGSACCYSRLAHDPVWARTIVIEQGETRIAWTTVDLVGFFYDDIRAIERTLPEELNVDYLMVSSTHSHEAPDGMGQWGPADSLPTKTGLTDQWRAAIYASVRLSVENAVDDLQQADVYASFVDTGLEDATIRDSREPYIVDDRLTMVSFTKPGMTPSDTNGVIGTLINGHNHPEALWSRNSHITSDFPHYIREYVESGLPEAKNAEGATMAPAIAGLGGTAIYVTGVVGGLTTPGGVQATDRAGVVAPDDSFEKADAMGQQLAEIAITNLREQSEKIDESQLVVRSRSFLLPVTNLQLKLALTGLGVLKRDVYNTREADNADKSRPSLIRTAVTRITLGELTIQGIPGEMFPELAVGFDPTNAFGNPWFGDPDITACGETMLPDTTGNERCIISPDNEYPPAIEEAPTSGFLRQTLPGTYHVLAGLTDDELGYLVPSYDFRWIDGAPGLVEAPGDHYEETNSISDSVAKILEMIDSLYE